MGASQTQSTPQETDEIDVVQTLMDQIDQCKIRHKEELEQVKKSYSEWIYQNDLAITNAIKTDDGPALLKAWLPRSVTIDGMVAEDDVYCTLIDCILTYKARKVYEFIRENNDKFVSLMKHHPDNTDLFGEIGETIHEEATIEERMALGLGMN